MEIRKLQYSISHIHILTFTDHIKPIIAPYFTYEPLEYGIDNENSLNQNVRLVFRKEGFIMQFNKEAAILLFEGDVQEVKRQNPIVNMFFDIYEKIKKIDGFIKIKNHAITTDAVKLLDKDEYALVLDKNKYLTNPFKNVHDFASVLEFKEEAKRYRLQFGNYEPKDIAKHNLLPLKVEYNDDLQKGVGLLAQLQIVEDVSTSNFSKFKGLINDAEDIYNRYL